MPCSSHWLNDADLANRETLETLAMESMSIRPALGRGPIRRRRPDLRSEYGEAIERSVFGSPTYFIDGDMFYGQDHSEMVERALRQPYKPSNFARGRTQSGERI